MKKASKELQLLKKLGRKNKELERQKRFLQTINDFSGLLIGKRNLNEIAWIITEELISKAQHASSDDSGETQAPIDSTLAEPSSV